MQTPTPRAAIARRSQLLRALGSLMLAVALIVGLVRGGAAYFSCAAMGVLDRPCCAVTHADDGQPAIARADCCDAYRLPVLPQASSGHAPSVAKAPLALSHVSLVVASPRAAFGGAELARFDARAGPTPRAPLRSTLMVFLL